MIIPRHSEASNTRVDVTITERGRPHSLYYVPCISLVEAAVHAISLSALMVKTIIQEAASCGVELLILDSFSLLAWR